MHDSPHEQGLERLTINSNPVSNFALDDAVPEMAASNDIPATTQSEPTSPQVSSGSATPDTTAPDDVSYEQLYKEWTATWDAGVVNELMNQEVRQDHLRKKLEGHWSQDECRQCPGCLQKKTYTHGVFGETDPARSPDPITVEEARFKAEPMSRRIWEDYAQLKAIIERYETVIQKRWAKKSIVKRKQTLRLAWAATSNPSPQPMAEVHRPDVHYLRNQCHCKGKKSCCADKPIEEGKRHLFFWPRLNLEDLTKFEPLLLLLNARGRHSPPTFAFADLEPVHFGVKVDRLSHPRYLDMHNMVFTGQESPEVYGQLVSWKEDSEAYHRLQMGRDTSPGEGLWILEIQERLYRFLVNICQLILHDQPVDERDRLLAQPVAPEPPLPTANGHGQDIGASLMITRYESAYHVPAKLDVRRLQNLVESKLAEAEDTLWALREDPSFFAATLAEWYQSCPEQLLDTANRRHPSVVKSDAKDKLMAHLVGEIWRIHVVAIERWAIIYDKVSHLADLKERLFDNAKVPIRPEEDLPQELAMSIYDLLFHLHNFLAGRLRVVFAEAQCSPPLRHLYRRRLYVASNQDHNEYLGEKVHLVCSGVMPSREMKELMWILRKMSQPDIWRSFGLHNCVEDIERITRDHTGREIISKMQAANLSDFTIVSECMRQLQLFHPWASTFEAGMANIETADELDDQYTATIIKHHKLFEWVPVEKTCAFGAMLAHLPYPVNKAPNKDNVDAMRKAESFLDAFWGDALLEFDDSELMTERLSKVLLGNIPERTPIWIEPPQTEATQDSENGITVRTFDIGLGYAQSSTKIGPVEPRIKIKSRGVARSSTTESEITIAKQDPQQPILPSIDVDKRASKVIDMLFYENSPGSSQGEISWTEFNYMMHYVGFGIEKLGGSSWQFTPGTGLTERGYTRGIQFHEPHPRAKLAFVVARRYGRRLSRAYGWCAEMFRLRSA